jgi:hypothetical protein
MKTIPAPSFWTNHNQLYLVHETETASTFQHGESLRNYLGRGRKAIVVYFLSCLVWWIIMSRVTPGSVLWKTMGIGFDSPFIHIFLFLWAVSMSWPFVFIIYLLVKPQFVVWTFDRVTEKLEHFTANTFGFSDVWYYPFKNIKSIDVTEHIEEDTISSKYYKLSIVFHNGDKFVMSKSDYTPNKQHQAIGHKHHLELAENMRFRVGLRNPTEYEPQF